MLHAIMPAKEVLGMIKEECKTLTKATSMQIEKLGDYLRVVANGADISDLVSDYRIEVTKHDPASVWLKFTVDDDFISTSATTRAQTLPGK